MRIGVIALGSWGTAIAQLLSSNGHQVIAYARDRELVDALRRERVNRRYLPNLTLSERIEFVADLPEATTNVDMVVSAVPTQGFRSSYEAYEKNLFDHTILVNLAKGIEITSGKTLSHIVPQGNYVALSGPTHAEEVRPFHPSAIVAASQDLSCAKAVQEVFSNEYFRVYTGGDIIGVEIAGALKNVIALAAGVVDGIGYGDNAKAALITRGLAEISRFGVALGADRETFSGLAGVGDMIVTCGSRHSRNLRCGRLIGSGVSPDEAMRRIGMVVEGVHTLKAVHTALKTMKDVEMPITEMLYRTLYEGVDPKEAITALMTRKTKCEKE